MIPPRAVFLDIGDTVLRANPSWEGVYTLALEEYGVSVPSEALRDALRSTYHHGRYGLEDGFDATPETSFRRTVEMDQRVRSTSWAWSRCRRSSSAACRSCSCWSAAGTSSPTRCRRWRRCATAAWSSARSATGSGSCPSCCTAWSWCRTSTSWRPARASATRSRTAASSSTPWPRRASAPRRRSTSATTSTRMCRARWRSASRRC